MKKKISFIVMIIMIFGVVLFKDPILAFAADFTEANYYSNFPVSGGSPYLVETDLNVLKKGETYTFRHFYYSSAYYNSPKYTFIFHNKDGSTAQVSNTFTSYTAAGEATSGYWRSYYGFDNQFTFTVPSNADNYDYWQFSNPYFVDSSGSGLTLNLEPYDYTAPTFSLSCNPGSIAVGEESDCSLNAHTSTNITSISFEIETPGYRLLSIQSGSNYKTLTNSSGLYSIEQKDNATPITSATDVEIVSMRIKSETTGVTDPQIKIKDLAYIDEVHVSGTTTSDPVIINVEPEASNPSTGLGLLYSTIIMTLLVTVVGVVSYVISRKKLESKI